MKPLYKRIVLKISGEAFRGESGISQSLYNKGFMSSICDEIIEIQQAGVELAVVVGGGNIFRGDQHGVHNDMSMDHFTGMTATIINGLLLQELLRKKKTKATCLSALPIHRVCDAYSTQKGNALLENGEILILAGGSGNPFCTTDFAGALRAIELKADILLKATKVDGVYDKDPKEHTDAKKYATISYSDALEQGLKVMDQTAFALAKEQSMPIQVFNIFVPGNITRAVSNKEVGTLVSGA